MSLEISLAIDYYNTSDITSDMSSSNLKKPSASFSKNILVLDDEFEIVSLIKHFLKTWIPRIWVYKSYTGDRTFHA